MVTYNGLDDAFGEFAINSITTHIVRWYAVFIIAYFVSHRNSILIKNNNPSNKEDFYYRFGLGNVFNGLRFGLYFMIPFCMSVELLNQANGIGSFMGRVSKWLICL